MLGCIMLVGRLMVPAWQCLVHSDTLLDLLSKEASCMECWLVYEADGLPER